MTIKEYDNAGIFLEDYEPILLEREAASQLLLYSAHQNLPAPKEPKGLFGAVLKDEEAVLLFCNIPEENLILYSVHRDKSAAAAAALADFMGEGHVTIAGINAGLDLCQSFMEQYKRHISCTFLQRLGTNIMEIRRVNDIKPVEGKQRLALPEEAKLIADWMIRFQMEALMSEIDYEAALNRATRLIKEGKIYLYENPDKVVVSMATAARKLVRGIAITYVFTPEEYRSKGYAAANMYYLSKALLEQGYEFCTLLVDKNNLLSSRAYEKVGYKIIEDNFEFKVIPAEA